MMDEVNGAESAGHGEVSPTAGSSRDVGTLLGGAIMVAFALWFGERAVQLPIGTPTNMGPGYFPVALSVITGIMGLILMLQGMRSTAGRIAIEWRPMIFISLSILAFALGMGYLGLVPAVIAAVVVASLADPDIGMLGALILGVVLAAFSWIVFSYALGLALPAFTLGA